VRPQKLLVGQEEDMMKGEPQIESLEAGDDAVLESAKRKQILDGARRIFFGHGFDAASMGEIAREAKVSKGTLYVYFDSKEALFSAIVDETKRETAERMMLELDPDDPDVAATLTTFATHLIEKITEPRHVAMVRMVIGASEKFPTLARIFFEAGPAHGARRLTDYFAAQTQAGRLAAPDPEIAAWQFMGLCTHPATISVLFAQDLPPPERIAKLAACAVATFLAAYAPRPDTRSGGR
jgi:AcrR family transcriptional regulator